MFLTLVQFHLSKLTVNSILGILLHKHLVNIQELSFGKKEKRCILLLRKVNFSDCYDD